MQIAFTLYFLKVPFEASVYINTVNNNKKKISFNRKMMCDVTFSMKTKKKAKNCINNKLINI